MAAVDGGEDAPVSEAQLFEAFGLRRLKRVGNNIFNKSATKSLEVKKAQFTQKR